MSIEIARWKNRKSQHDGAYDGGVKRPWVVFGNVAVGPIAIGNVAMGYVAIGLSVAVGPIAIGINSLGILLAVGVNAAGVVSLAGVNGFGALTLAGVNGLGTFVVSFVNQVPSALVAGLFALSEGAAAAAIYAAYEERPRGLLAAKTPDDVAVVRCSRIDERGLTLREASFLPWDESVAPEDREAAVRALGDGSDVLVRVRLHETSVPTEGDDYRKVGASVLQRACLRADVEPIRFWYLPVFRQALTIGAAIAAVVTVLGLLR